MEAGPNNPRSGNVRQRNQRGPVRGCVDGGSAGHPSLVVGDRRDCVDVVAANTSVDPLWTGLGRSTSRMSGLENAVANDSGGSPPRTVDGRGNRSRVEYVAHGVAQERVGPGIMNGIRAVIY